MAFFPAAIIASRPLMAGQAFAGTDEEKRIEKEKYSSDGIFPSVKLRWGARNGRQPSEKVGRGPFDAEQSPAP